MYLINLINSLDNRKYSIDIGINNLNQPDKWSLIDLKPAKLIMHPQFDAKLFDNDIALIKLKVCIKANLFSCLIFYSFKIHLETN